MISVVSSSTPSSPPSSPSSSPLPSSSPCNPPSLLSPLLLVEKSDDKTETKKEQPILEETSSCVISLIKKKEDGGLGSDGGFGMSAISTKTLKEEKSLVEVGGKEKEEDGGEPNDTIGGFREKEGLFVRNERRVCKICEKTEGPAYQCPRCEIPYCSLVCYKSHDQTCTEGFYKEQVDTELKTKSSTHADQKKMMESLKNLQIRDNQDPSLSLGFHDDDPSNQYAPFQRPFSQGALEELEEEEEALFSLFDKDIHEELANLPELNPDSIVQFLSSLPEEKFNRFATAALDGDLSHLMEPWVPWWFETKTSSLLLGGSSGSNGFVQEVSEGDGEKAIEEEGKEGGEGEKEEKGERVRVVPDPGPIKPFGELFPSTKKPSPTLPYDLVDILFGYGMMMRRCNGEWNDASVLSSCVEDVFSFSQVVGEGKVFGSMSLVFEGKVAFPSLRREEVFAISLDCLSLLKRKRYVLGALGDTRHLLRTYLSKSKEGKGKGPNKELVRKTKMAERKLSFFLSWGYEQTPSVFEGLAIQAMVEQGNLKVEPKRGFIPKKKTVLLPVRK